ncbi:MAG: hypothetical protein U5R31_08355 [Acidimicrobiia bacterium]|nr:hypothetical protein [Acidimicrobiia bacterium]
MAVTVNGVLAGFAPVYEIDGRLGFGAMTHPSHHRAGANDIAVHVVEASDDGSVVLHPLGG